MRQETFSRKLMRLVIPISLQYFMFALVPVSDAVMLVGMDKDAMSAVSLAGQVFFVFNLFNYALMAGLSMFAAQYWGKGDVKSIEKLLGYVTRLAIPVAVIFFSISFFMPDAVMRIYTHQEVIIAHGINYLRIVSVAYIFEGVAQLCTAILKNTDHVKICTAITVSMVTLNIILNAVFIYGLLGAPAMGESGAALATSISSLYGAVAVVIAMIVKCPVRIRISRVFKVDMNMRREFSKYSSALLINQMFWGIGFTLVTVIIGQLNDADVIAANAIAAVVKDLASCFCWSLADGGAIMVGNELGAGNLERGKKYGQKIVNLAIITGIIFGAVTASLAYPIVKLTNLNPDSSHYLFYMLLMCVYYILGRSINAVIIGGIFASGGDTKFGMICDLVTMWVFIIPAGALAAFVFHAPPLVVYFILNLDEMIKIPVVFHHFKQYKWVKNLVGRDDPALKTAASDN